MSELKIIGIDEVGRGCLAGPIAACAFFYPDGALPVAGVKDSKKLTPKAREKLEPLLIAAGNHGYGEVSAAEIDDIGINAANFLAMRRAVEALGLQDLAKYSIVVDGNVLPPFEDMNAGQLTCIVKADDLIPEVSAASVLAKVRRDRDMATEALKYPGYAFESNSGYGSPAHMSAVAEKGPCPLHRMSFAPLSNKLKRGPRP